MDAGWVYILTNDSLQSNYLKIGHTTNEPSGRAADLSSASGVATPFNVVYSEVVPDCIRAEALVHRKLADHRVSNNREFFQIDLVTAQKTVHEICEIVRNESSFCRQCDANAAKAELRRLRDELKKNKIEVKRLRKRISILASCRNFISIVVSTVKGAYQKAVPDRGARRIYTWWIILPLGITGWILLLFLFRYIAIALLLTAILLAALVVLGSTTAED